MVMKTRRWIASGLAAAAAIATAATVTTTAATAATMPARHVYSRQDLQRDLNAIVATGVPGVLAEVRSGGRELRGTSGVANLDSGKPVNDTVGRWLPGVVHGHGNDGGKITVRELLQHTSGLENYTDDLQARITSPAAYRKLEFEQFRRKDLLSIALAHKPYFAPGTGFHYSNTNYVLLGMVIEKVTHHSWEDQVTRRIIKPLGLHHTFAPGNSTALPRPHATGYLIFSKTTRVDTTAENMSWANSAGALISTAADLTRFWSAIGRGELLPPAQHPAHRRRQLLGTRG
jgi:D-alanyl-D-alanine carboxypeptidase